MDVAEKNGNMNTDIVTGALERSTTRIMGPSYMKAGMGDGGACHPRDNIALRYISEKYELGYDLFEPIMTAREEQARNIAKRLMELHDVYELPIIILGESYKPGVPYTDGSYTKLIGYYLENKLEYKGLQYDKTDSPAVYLLGHRGVHNTTNFPKGSIVLDPWRERLKKDTIYYGNKVTKWIY
jgi:UDPglucose 6-dehydrogenase